MQNQIAVAAQLDEIVAAARRDRHVVGSAVYGIVEVGGVDFRHRGEIGDIRRAVIF